MVIRRLVYVIFVGICCFSIDSCTLMANTTREYKDKKFMLDINTMEVVTQKKTYISGTRLLLNLIDSNTKKYKTYLIDESFDVIPERYSLLKQSSFRDSITKNYSRIILYTDIDKTWYDVDISPQDWQA